MSRSTNPTDEQLLAAITAQQQGDLVEAERIYRERLMLNADDPDALHLLGMVYHQKGNSSAALDFIQKAIVLQPKQSLFHGNLGRVLRAAGKAAAAVDAFRSALRYGGTSAELHTDLADALLALGEIDAARSRARLAMDIDPSHAPAHVVLGRALDAQGGTAQAEASACFAKACSLDPTHGEAQFHYGRSLHENGEISAAQKAYEKALLLQPDMVEAIANLGNLLRQMNRWADAIPRYRQALQLDPDNAVILGNLGVALHEQGRVEDALRSYDKAVAINPDDAEVRRNRAMALLSMGRFDLGWQQYEYRWQTKRFQHESRPGIAPLWQGEDVVGRTVLVHSEQGLGDSIQFSRFLKTLVELGASVVFVCPKPLIRFFEATSLKARLLAEGDPLPDVDFEIPLMSLPHRLKMTTFADIPSSVMLEDRQLARQDWRNRLQDVSGLKIGIAWKGSPDHPRDDLRSPGLAAFDKVLSIPGLSFVSLQKEGGREDIEALGWQDRVADVSADLHDFLDTATLIQSLDGVIACDTSVAHLSGSVGARTSLILPHMPEWRWFPVMTPQPPTDTPWYPSVRLFLQENDANWSKTILQAVKLFTDEIRR